MQQVISFQCSSMHVFEKPIWSPEGEGACAYHDTEDNPPYMNFGFCILLISAHAIG